MKNKLLFFFIFILSFNLFAAQGFIDFKTFKTLTYSKQVKTIKLVHQFLNEYDRQKLIHFDKKQKKYVEYKKILNFFINSAYADNSGSNKLCYYAGWTSMMIAGSCTHPGKLEYPDNKKLIANLLPGPVKDALQNTNKAYESSRNNKATKVAVDNNGKFSLNNSKTCGNSEQNIMCNPKIYGQLDKTNFCVSGNSNDGLNSSYFCNKALETVKAGVAPKLGLDKYNQIMEGIIKAALASDDLGQLKNSLGIMFDMCLCGKSNESFQQKLSYKYSQKMFYTRTCYGILNQVQAITTSLPSTNLVCLAQENNVSNDKEIEAWIQFLNNASNFIKAELDEQAPKLSGISQIADEDYNGKSLAQIQGIVKEAFDYDNDQFKAVRDKHFDNYSAAGLCKGPQEIVGPPVPEPAPLPQKNPGALAVAHSEFVWINNGIFSKLEVDIEENEIDCKKKDINFGETSIYREDETMYTNISPQVYEIQAKCSETHQAKASIPTLETVCTYEIVLPTKEKDGALSVSIPALDQVTNMTIENYVKDLSANIGATPFTRTAGSLNFVIPKDTKESEESLVVSLKVNGFEPAKEDAVLCSKSETPKTQTEPEKKKEKESCSLKLAANDLGNGAFSLVPTITIGDKSVESQADQIVIDSLTFFDKTRAAVKTKKSKKKRKVASDNMAGDDAPKKKKATAKSASKNNFFQIATSNKAFKQEVRQEASKKTYLAILKTKMGCSATATADVLARPPAYRPKVKGFQPMKLAPTRGRFLGGNN